MKIAIYGYSGSGKSTLAKYLGSCCEAPVLHLDTVQFLPGRERHKAQMDKLSIREAGKYL